MLIKKKTMERLEALRTTLDTIDFSAIMSEAVDEAQDKFDNWSEITQESERGELTEEFIDHLTNAMDSFDEFYSELCEALEIDI